MEDGWLDRGLNCFGGPGVLVLLVEVKQGSIAEGGRVFFYELAVEARPGG